MLLLAIKAAERRGFLIRVGQLSEMTILNNSASGVTLKDHKEAPVSVEDLDWHDGREAPEL